MKAGLTKSAIDAFADALLSENAADAAARLKALAAIFHGLATRPMRDLLDLLDRVTPTGDGAADTSVASVAAVIGSLRNLELILTKTSTRGRRDDLIAFRAKLQRHESGNIETLVKAVQFLRRGKRDEEPVDTNDCMRLAEQLKAALGLVSRVSPVQTAVRNCAGDEGGPFGFGDQVADPKPPQAAVGKSHGGERCGKVGTMIPTGKVERGERKRTASEASKAA